MTIEQAKAIVAAKDTSTKDKVEQLRQAIQLLADSALKQS